jgi:glycosyltransferase involved in cell wall biosynthesis
MSDCPIITIVTPSFNQQAYIGQTIESVISQEGMFRIEYYVMDGGSTDNSAEKIAHYAEVLRRGAYPIRCAGVTLEWVSERDRGQSDAINRGLRKASGAFAAYINSDDVYCPGAFAAVLQTFREHPQADFVYGDGDVIDENGRPQWEWLSRPYDLRVLTAYHFLWNDFTNYIMQQAVFWRTDVHDRIGLFDEDFHFAMDVEYWIRAGHARLNLLHVPIKLAKFRMISGTKSLSSPVAFWSDYLEIFRRYCGAGKLSKVLAFYYFNWMKYRNFDLAGARSEADGVIDRWKTLPEDERKSLHQQCERAFPIACFLAANDLQRRGDFERAEAAIQVGKAEGTWKSRRFAFFYAVLKQFLGRNQAPRLDIISDYLIQMYRRKRFDYRYHQRRGTP